MTTANHALVDDLVAANHILYVEGVVDGFGHVSVRHDQRADRFLLACGVAPATVTADDILEVDFNGVVHDEAGRRSYLERFIHSEIYKAHPDVMAIVHSHSPAIIPFSVTTRVTLKPVCQMSGFLGFSTPIFEIRDTAGDDNNMLVTRAKLGRALAESLGTTDFALMRGHGSVTVAKSLRLAVARATWAEMNAKLQTEALRMAGTDGDAGVNYLTPVKLQDRWPSTRRWWIGHGISGRRKRGSRLRVWSGSCRLTSQIRKALSASLGCLRVNRVSTLRVY